MCLYAKLLRSLIPFLKCLRLVEYQCYGWRVGYSEQCVCHEPSDVPHAHNMDASIKDWHCTIEFGNVPKLMTGRLFVNRSRVMKLSDFVIHGVILSMSSLPFAVLGSTDFHAIDGSFTPPRFPRRSRLEKGHSAQAIVTWAASDETVSYSRPQPGKRVGDN